MEVFGENLDNEEVKIETVEHDILDFPEEDCLYSIKEESRTNHLIRDCDTMTYKVVPIKNEVPDNATVSNGTKKPKVENRVSSRFN